MSIATALPSWQANMDFQFIIDAYACLMYVASYVMKAEKGMSEILKTAVKEFERDSVRVQLRKLGSVFLHNREVSAQEAVYRALSMHLRKCSRSVVFVHTDVPERQIGLLLPQDVLQDKDADDEDVRCKNMIDRYVARPISLEHICLADFVSVYTYCRGKSSKEYAYDSHIEFSGDEDTDNNQPDQDTHILN